VFTTVHKFMPESGEKMPELSNRQGHGLMQAIARVNRVFKNKLGGLIVDYLGLADQLKQALATYTESGGKGNPTIDAVQAIAVLKEKFGVAKDMMHGFNWSKWVNGMPAERLALIPAGQEHILEQDDGKMRAEPKLQPFPS